MTTNNCKHKEEPTQRRDGQTGSTRLDVMHTAGSHLRDSSSPHGARRRDSMMGVPSGARLRPPTPPGKSASFRANDNGRQVDFRRLRKQRGVSCIHSNTLLVLGTADWSGLPSVCVSYGRCRAKTVYECSIILIVECIRYQVLDKQREVLVV